MPDTIGFDDTYGVFYNSIVMLTMPDPFWQRPYWPYNPYHSIGFQMDEGNGPNETDDLHRFYAHYPVVEARLLAGSGLPVTGIFDSAIAPPFFSSGIQWSSSGYNCQPGITWGFADGAVMDWIFALNVCAGGGAFTIEYTYVQC